MVVAKKLGNEDVTKEFEIPAGLHDEPTNVISLRNEKVEPAPQAPQQAVVSAAPVELIAKETSQLSKVVHVFAGELKKLVMIESRLNTGITKLAKTKSEISLAVTAGIKTAVNETLSLGLKKIQLQLQKSSQQQAMLHKKQLDEMKKDLLECLRETQTPGGNKHTSESEVAQLHIQVEATRQMVSDALTLSNTLEELHREKSQLEHYISGLRQEFHERELGLKSLEHRKKELEAAVEGLEEEIKNYRDYLNK